MVITEVTEQNLSVIMLAVYSVMILHCKLYIVQVLAPGGGEMK